MASHALLRCAAIALLAASPALARESLGVFDHWAAFRDAGIPRCYAIAMPAQGRHPSESQPYITIGTWPDKAIRGQVHFHLARAVRAGQAITLKLGGQYIALSGSGSDAWSRDARSNAAILAALRSTPDMTVFATDRAGKRFYDTYALAGAASAMDAATLGCSARNR